MIILAIAILVPVGLMLTARIYLGRSAEDHLAEGEGIDFSTLAPPASPNHYLVCPRDFCTAPADQPAPVYPVSWERLRDSWRSLMAHEQRLKGVAGDGDLMKITYIQRTAILRFPDLITVEFIPLGEDRSTLAIYSRSRYGYSDMGVNRQRVTRWLDRLSRALGAPAGAS